MSFVTIPATDVDAKSPVDDALMGTVKADLDDLNTRVVAAGANPYTLELWGSLSEISTRRRSVCATVLNDAFTPTSCRYSLKKGGTSGTLAFDIRKHTSPKTAIIEIAHQYTAATSSIARQGTQKDTSSIARATAQISTQSITHAKASKATQSVILLGTTDRGVNTVQYNLDTALSADTIVGDFLVMASHTSAQNDGTFVIVEIGRGGGSNVVVINSAGVAQTGIAGTVQEKIMSYNFTNPVNTLFTAGYSHLFAAHTSAVNDGTLPVYAINQAGNNVWVKNALGATQGGVAGTMDTNLWIYTLNSSANTTDYTVGEKAHATSHTLAVNDGELEIVLVNSGGNNVILYNLSGAVQGGVAGHIDTNRWKYNLPSDPTTSSNVAATDTVYMSGHTNADNDGTFTVKDITSSTIVVYNLMGVAQAATPGNVYTTRKLIKFVSDQSASYTVTTSYIEILNAVSDIYNLDTLQAPFQVLQVNRGGGSNYNVVIDCPTGPAQASPGGYVQVEMKSIFSSSPSLAVDVTGTTPNQNVTGSSTSMVATSIAAGTPIMLYLTSIPSGDPQDLTVFLL